MWQIGYKHHTVCIEIIYRVNVKVNRAGTFFTVIMMVEIQSPPDYKIIDGNSKPCETHGPQFVRSIAYLIRMQCFLLPVYRVRISQKTIANRCAK